MHSFQLDDGFLYYTVMRKDKGINFNLVVPDELKAKALKFSHESIGHLGTSKTIDKIKELFFWENLRVDAKAFCKRCNVCALTKGTTGIKTKYQTFPPVTKPLERVSVDTADMIAGQGELRYVLTIIDNYSGFVKLWI